MFNNLECWPVSQIENVKLDLYDGSDPSDLGLAIREELSNFIVLSTDTTRPILANFFTEFKGPSRDLNVLERQALRDAGEGGRAMVTIRTHLDPQTAYDSNAYTTIFTYAPNGLLNLYTVHAVKVKGNVYPCELRIIRHRSFAMLDSPDTFREGATWFRNARELMKEYRDSHIDRANKKEQTQQAVAVDEAVQAPPPMQHRASIIVAVPPLQPATRQGLRPPQ